MSMIVDTMMEMPPSPEVKRENMIRKIDNYLKYFFIYLFILIVAGIGLNVLTIGPDHLRETLAYEYCLSQNMGLTKSGDDTREWMCVMNNNWEFVPPSIYGGK